MTEKRKAGRPGAPKGNPGREPKSDPRAKRIFRIDVGVARRYEAHCVLRGIDTNKHLETILVSYLGGSYWVDKSRDGAQATDAAAAPTAGPTGPGHEAHGAAS